MTDIGMLGVTIRPEQRGDAPAVRRVLEAAFPQATEADLVERLRADRDIALALVAEQHAQIVGYVAFCRLAVETAEKRTKATGLAPLAVMPDLQRRGIGDALVRAGLDALGRRGEQLVFVLGEPAYYGRFGFDVAAAAGFQCVYAGPYFMLLRMTPDAPREGTVRYPAAFDSL